MTVICVSLSGCPIVLPEIKICGIAAAPHCRAELRWNHLKSLRPSPQLFLPNHHDSSRNRKLSQPPQTDFLYHLQLFISPLNNLPLLKSLISNSQKWQDRPQFLILQT
jgi:hypothetical protein